MKGLTMSQTQRNRIKVVLALAFVAAMLIPQFPRAADNAADVPFTCTGLGYGSTVDLTAHEAACSHYFDLVELYRTGQLEYHAPGR